MSRKIWVVAANPDLPTPREGAPRRLISAEKPVLVEPSGYYRKRLAANELKEITEAQAKEMKSAAQGKGADK